MAAKMLDISGGNVVFRCILGINAFSEFISKTSLLKEMSWIWGLKPHCIRCSHFKVDDVSALEPSSKLPVRIVEDNVTASLHQQRTP
jgi:hypothetical protein